MKKAAVATALFFLLASGQALAATWTDEFTKDFNKLGLDVATENALANDVTPQAILDYVVKNKEKFNSQLSLKALYCAGVDIDVVARAASALGLLDQVVKKTLQESIEECGSKVALTDRDILDLPEGGALTGTAPVVAPTPTTPVSTQGTSNSSSNSSTRHSGTSSSSSTVPPTTGILPPPPPPESTASPSQP